ncbi:MAG: hypothetical protein AAB465_03455 [Patescibacteria group bacterium]
MLKQIFKKSYQTALYNPLLWVFGFFSTIFLGNEMTILINQTNSTLNLVNNVYIKNLFSFKENLSSGPNYIIFGLLVYFILAILVAISAFAQASLISGINKEKNASFKNCVQKGASFFWLIFLLNIIGLIIINVIFVLMGSLLIKATSFETRLLPLIVFFCILIGFLINFIIIFLAKFAAFHIVLGKDKFWSSLKKASIFLGKNWKDCLLIMACILGFSFLFGLIFIIISMGVILPFSILGIISYYFGWGAFFYGLLMVNFCLIMIMLLIAISFFTVFQYSVWVYFFKNKVDL